MEQSTSADGSEGPNGELNSPPEHRGEPEMHTSILASPALRIAPRALIDSYEQLRRTGRLRGQTSDDLDRTTDRSRR
jgi:hypothetical protein